MSNEERKYDGSLHQTSKQIYQLYVVKNTYQERLFKPIQNEEKRRKIHQVVDEIKTRLEVMDWKKKNEKAEIDAQILLEEFLEEHC